MYVWCGPTWFGPAGSWEQVLAVMSQREGYLCQVSDDASSQAFVPPSEADLSPFKHVEGATKRPY